MLDTNILSNLFRHPNGTIFFKIKEVGEASICTSIVVACELAFGAEKKQSKRLQERVDLILDLFPIMPMLASMEKVYGEIRALLERQGTPIDQ
ncbi:PIN domain-containing protein [Synechocystis salina]|uniref:PIN domain-containing protein n=1 Tax=Synechocystis salina TaxID=945780 RepID=UPI001D14CCA2|nr:PIN domain-containing protein [Synechocystis salina]